MNSIIESDEKKFIPFCMEKRMNKFVAIAAVLVLVCACRQQPSEYAGLEYRGGKDIRTTAFSSVDTLYIDAGATSLEGAWHLSRGRLLFLDRRMVGVREYDTQGNFIARHIHRGRGPNEMIAPPDLSEPTPDGGLVMMDGSWWLSLYDSLYHGSNGLDRVFADLGAGSFDWNHLLRNPDPEVRQMYEPYLLIGRIKIADSILLLPVITEHVSYNGYEVGNGAKKYWRETHNMITVDLRDLSTGELFGSYPPVYQERVIPVFSEFDFDVEGDKLYTSFAADSLIYVRDVTDGRLLYSFGCAAQGVSTLFPATSSFEEYEEVYDAQREEYGYYTRLVCAGDYLFRGYKKEGEAGYGFQLYRDGVLVGDIPVEEEIRIIGAECGVFYAALPPDLDGERFRILRFTLTNMQIDR
jgi:hypothetical protein